MAWIVQSRWSVHGEFAHATRFNIYTRADPDLGHIADGTSDLLSAQ